MLFFWTSSTKILRSTTVFNINNNNNENISRAANQLIRIISEWSFDTEDWSIDCWKFINKLKWFYIVTLFHNIFFTVLSVKQKMHLSKSYWPQMFEL